MAITAAALKRSIEVKLADRIPAALSHVPQGVPRLQPTADRTINALLGGGFPLGSLCEITGPESSGRSSIAMALLSSASHRNACAYIDVSNALSPHSAAASGVLLRNLLWVRLRASEEHEYAHLDPLQSQPAVYKQPQPTRQHGSSNQHPRRETAGLTSELELMLFYKQERRRKMEGTPGYPNQPVGLSEVPSDQVEWEQFNSRKADDRDPLRQLDKAAAEAARQRAAAVMPICNRRTQPTKPWDLLDRGLRATDHILQAGGFCVVVLDLASTPPEQALRIQSSTWWRYQKAAKHSDTILIVLSQVPCARSSAACVVECASGCAPKIQGVFTSVQHTIKVTRQRTGSAHGEKVLGRITGRTVAPAWMRAVGG